MGKCQMKIVRTDRENCTICINRLGSYHFQLYCSRYLYLHFYTLTFILLFYNVINTFLNHMKIKLVSDETCNGQVIPDNQ